MTRTIVRDRLTYKAEYLPPKAAHGRRLAGRMSNGPTGRAIMDFKASRIQNRDSRIDLVPNHDESLAQELFRHGTITDME